LFLVQQQSNTAAAARKASLIKSVLVGKKSGEGYRRSNIGKEKSES
jgi:hypothetical protein